METIPGVGMASGREGLRVPRGLGTEAFLDAACVPAGELRERLLAFVAHEIRNPLASALWSAEMLARGGPWDGRRDRLAQLGVRSVRRLRMLLEDLFALERLPATAPAGEVPLADAVERALGPRDVDPAGIPARVGPIPEGLIIPLDPLWLDRLVSAVARRLSRVGPPGPLEVCARPADGAVDLVLSKAGVLADALDPPALTPGGSEGEGTTFTLMLARQVARRLGVGLGVTSTDGGAAIRLSLPCRAR